MKYGQVVWLIALCGNSVMAMAQPSADAPPAAVKEFKLADLKNNFHTPAEWAGKKAVVLLFLGTECPVSNGYAPEYTRLFKAFADRGVLFYGVHPDPDVTAQAALKHAAEHRLEFIILLDPTQVLARQTGIQVVPEAVVLSAAGQVLYRGRIDDRYAPDGKRRDVAKTRDLDVAIQAVLAGKPAPAAAAKAFGCPLPAPSSK